MARRLLAGWKVVCASVVSALALGCAEHSMTAPQREASLASITTVGSTVASGATGLRAEIARLRQIAANPELRSQYLVDMPSRSGATIEDLLAALQSAQRVSIGRTSIQSYAAVDSANTPRCFTGTGGDMECGDGYSTIGRNASPPNARDVTFAAGTLCTSGPACSRGLARDLGGTMHTSMNPQGTPFVTKKSFDFHGPMPFATARYDVDVSGPAWNAAVETDHWLQDNQGTTWPFASSATSGPI